MTERLPDAISDLKENVMTAQHHDFAGDRSTDRVHVELLLARLWAAKHALAAEIAQNLEISENAAQVLARIRIDEVIDSYDATDDDLVPAYPNESYCRQCWALVASEPARQAGCKCELFERCIYCGQPAHSDDEWEEAA